MKMTLTRTIDGAPWEDLGTFEGSTAHDDQFLNPDPRCRLQLRRLMPSDFPPDVPLFGTTALLWVNDDPNERPMKLSVQIDPELIVNSRAGVLRAIACIARIAPDLAGSLRNMARCQTVWGVPEVAAPVTGWPPAAAGAGRPAEAFRPKRSRRSQRRNRR